MKASNTARLRQPFADGKCAFEPFWAKLELPVIANAQTFHRVFRGELSAQDLITRPDLVMPAKKNFPIRHFCPTFLLTLNAFRNRFRLPHFIPAFQSCPSSFSPD